MILIDGNKLAKKILDNVKEKVQKEQLKLKLAVVLVGGNAVSSSYINKKKEACKYVGAEFELINFSLDVKEEELKKEVMKLAQDNSVSGIVIQLPLPKNLNTQEILNLIPEEKDIDVLSDSAFKNFSERKLNIFPPVAGAVRYILKENKIDIKDKKIALVGKGKLVGRPLFAWLSNIGAEVFVIDRAVKNVEEITREADIIISGVGVPGLIKENMVKDGVILIDAGSASEDGEVKGDIDKKAYGKASFVSPVPGGVGPVTVAILLDNLLNICYPYKREE